MSGTIDRSQVLKLSASSTAFWSKMFEGDGATLRMNRIYGFFRDAENLIDMLTILAGEEPGLKRNKIIDQVRKSGVINAPEFIGLVSELFAIPDIASFILELANKPKAERNMKAFLAELGDLIIRSGSRFAELPDHYLETLLHFVGQDLLIIAQTAGDLPLDDAVALYKESRNIFAANVAEINSPTINDPVIASALDEVALQLNERLMEGGVVRVDTVRNLITDASSRRGINPRLVLPLAAALLACCICSSVMFIDNNEVVGEGIDQYDTPTILATEEYEVGENSTNIVIDTQDNLTSVANDIKEDESVVEPVMAEGEVWSEDNADVTQTFYPTGRLDGRPGATSRGVLLSERKVGNVDTNNSKVITLQVPEQFVGWSDVVYQWRESGSLNRAQQLNILDAIRNSGDQEMINYVEGIFATRFGIFGIPKSDAIQLSNSQFDGLIASILVKLLDGQQLHHSAIFQIVVSDTGVTLLLTAPALNQ